MEFVQYNSDTSSDEISKQGRNTTFATMNHVHTTTANNTQSSYKMTVGIQNVPITMEIDTGSSVTLITKEDFLKTRDTCDTLKPTTLVLTGYGGSPIRCIGEKDMTVTVGDQEDTVLVRVVDVKGPSLLG